MDPDREPHRDWLKDTTRDEESIERVLWESVSQGLADWPRDSTREWVDAFVPKLVALAGVGVVVVVMVGCGVLWASIPQGVAQRFHT